VTLPLHGLINNAGLGVGLVGPRTRAHRSHVYVLALSVDEWLPYFTEEKVRVSPERDGIRVTFGLFNTIEDVDRFVEVLRRRR
jgi:selenocysteine lyase/cysteine desulfurase